MSNKKPIVFGSRAFVCMADLLFGLENNASHNVVSALQKVLDKGTYDMQLMAVDQLSLVATTASVTPVPSMPRAWRRSAPTAAE